MGILSPGYIQLLIQRSFCIGGPFFAVQFISEGYAAHMNLQV